MVSVLEGYKKIFAEVRGGVKHLVYLLRGRENFIMEQFADRITESVVNDETRSFNLDIEYGSDVDISDFIKKANSFPFMSDRRVLMLKELETMTGGCKELADYCCNPATFCVMVIFFNTHDEKGRKNRVPRGFRELQKAIGNQGRLIEFEKLKEKDLESWIIQRSKKLGVEMASQEARSIVRNVGDNLYDIRNELDKVAILYEGGRVDSKDLSMIIGSYRFNAVYDLIDSLGVGNERESLEILLRILSSGAEKPSSIVYNLIRSMLTLLKIKYGYRAGGYWFSKKKKQADFFKEEEIKLWLENLRTADIKIKSSYLPDEFIILNCFLNSMEKKLYTDYENSYYQGVG